MYDAFFCSIFKNWVSYFCDYLITSITPGRAYSYFGASKTGVSSGAILQGFYSIYLWNSDWDKGTLDGS